MLENCPFNHIKRSPDYQSTAPNEYLVDITDKETFGNGYGQMIKCICRACGQSFVVEGNHNPYYEVWIWPEIPPCITIPNQKSDE